MTIAEALETLEQAIKDTPPMPYEQTHALWRECERLMEELANLMMSAPDYPTPCDICGKIGAKEQEDGSVLCEEHATMEPSR